VTDIIVLIEFFIFCFAATLLAALALGFIHFLLK
jgi:hypothetical protein